MEVRCNRHLACCRRAGTPAVQINTDGGCHLEAGQVTLALDALPLDKTDLVFIENVGNLICTNNYVLGEDIRLMIASMPEGDDKPLKYPAMFADSDVVIISKIDLQPYLDFNEKNFLRVVNGLNADVTIFPLSCKTGKGMDAWYKWLEKTVKDKKGKKKSKFVHCRSMRSSVVRSPSPSMSPRWLKSKSAAW